MHWLAIMILIIFGLVATALARRLRIGFPILCGGIRPIATLVISALLWWLALTVMVSAALTVMVSAAALRWQDTQDRIAVRSASAHRHSTPTGIGGAPEQRDAGHWSVSPIHRARCARAGTVWRWLGPDKVGPGEQDVSVFATEHSFIVGN
jgi:hypothetical protein